MILDGVNADRHTNGIGRAAAYEFTSHQAPFQLHKSQRLRRLVSNPRGILMQLATISLFLDLISLSWTRADGEMIFFETRRSCQEGIILASHEQDCPHRIVTMIPSSDRAIFFIKLASDMVLSFAGDAFD